MAARKSSISDFILDSYKQITNVYAAGAGLPAPFPNKREPRCEGFDSLDITGETAIPCLARTVKCPVCGKESGLCAAHLLECHKCGKKMCSECAEAVDWPCRGCQQAVLEETEPGVNAALDEISGKAVRS